MRDVLYFQGNCCCRALAADDCYDARYPMPIDDAFRDRIGNRDSDEYCQCGCHDEIAGDDDDDTELEST